MGSGNRTLKAPDKRAWLLSGMPEPLAYLVRQYQFEHAFPSFSYAARVLLESHPDIALLMNRLYDQQVEHLEHQELST